MDAKDFFRASKARTERGYTTFDIALDTAINDQVLNLPGTLFFLDKSSTGICTVEGNVGQGTSRNPLLASPGFSMFNEEGFADFRISAAAQPGKVLKIVIATGMSIKPGDQVTSGAVSTQTVDAGLVRTNANQAFLATGQCGAVAAQMSYVQLWNPVGSGKNVMLESMTIGSPAVSSIYVLTANAQVTTFYNNFASKKIGGAIGVGTLRTENNAGALGVSYMLGYQVAAGVPQTINFREPIVIAPGTGINVQNQTVNQILTANFETFEQA